MYADLISTMKWSKHDKETSQYPEEKYIKLIKEKYVPSDSMEVKVMHYSKDFLMYTFYEVNPANIFNPYDQVKVVFGNERNVLVLFDHFNDFKIKKAPQTTKVEAQKIAKGFLSHIQKKESKMVSTIALKVIKSNNFYQVNRKMDFEQGVLYLAYFVKFGDLIVYVDAYDGKVIGGSSF